MTSTQRYWFPAKRFGWGWGPPKTWEGWVVVVAYVVTVAVAAILLAQRKAISLAAIVTVTLVLLWVCLKKGEPTRWRWNSR